MILGCPQLLIFCVEGLVSRIAASAAERNIHGDATQPSREFRSARELVQVLIRTDKRIFDNVFRFGIVADNGERQPVQACAIAAHEDLEVFGLTSKNARHQFLICAFVRLVYGIFTIAFHRQP
jgi:hypothetical protein